MDNKLKVFKKLRVARLKLLAELKFLIWCRKVKLFPRTLAVKPTGSSSRVCKATVRANLQILRAHIKDKRSLIESKEFQLYLLHLELAKHFNQFDWAKEETRSFVEANAEARSKEASLLSKRWNLVHLNNAGKKVKGVMKVKVVKEVSRQSNGYTGEELRSLVNNVVSIPKTVAHALQDLGIYRRKCTRVMASTKLDVGPPQLGKPLVNLSSATLSSEQERLLMKGSKFALGPTYKDGTLLAAAVEKELSQVEEPRRTFLRNNLIAQSCTTTMVLSPHWKTLRSIQDLGVKVLKADKGETVVLMDQQDFATKMGNELESGTYKKLKKDPLPSTVKRLNNLLKSFTNELLKGSKVPSPAAPKLFAQVKIHKAGTPLRLIVSGRNSPTSKLEKNLASFIGKYVSCNSSAIGNSGKLVELLKVTPVPSPDELLLSLDIVQLFPNLPRTGTLEALDLAMEDDAVPTDLKREILEGVKFVLDNAFFKFGGCFYQQIKGSPIGSSLSPYLAEVFLNGQEKRARSLLECWPRLFVRYVDDHLTIVSKEKVDEVLSVLNSMSADIQYTVEKANDNSIAFLDVHIAYKQGEFFTSVFRKPTASGILLNKDSMHHPSHKSNTWATLVHRAHSVCSNESLLEAEICHLKSLASLNGFSHHVIDQAVSKHRRKRFRKESTSLIPFETNQANGRVVLPYLGKVSTIIGNALRSETGKQVVYQPLNKLGAKIFNSKEPIQPSDKAGVYRVDCNCGALYIGQTKRFVSKRLKEHKAALFNFSPSNSAIARHFWESGCDAGIKWDEGRVVVQCHNPSVLKFCEQVVISLEQRVNEGKLMNDQDNIGTLAMWAQMGCKWLRAPSVHILGKDRKDNVSQPICVEGNVSNGRESQPADEQTAQGYLSVSDIRVLQQPPESPPERSMERSLPAQGDNDWSLRLRKRVMLSHNHDGVKCRRLGGES